MKEWTPRNAMNSRLQRRILRKTQPRSRARLLGSALALVLLTGAGWTAYQMFGPEEQSATLQASSRASSAQDAARLNGTQETAAQRLAEQNAVVPGVAPRADVVPSAREKAAILRAAENAMETLGTFSYRTVDADLQRMLKVTTGSLRTQFRANLDGTRRQIVAQQLTKRAAVLRVRFKTLNAARNRATATLLIASTGTSQAQPSPREQRYNLSLALVKVKGVWRVSAVTTPRPAR